MIRTIFIVSLLATIVMSAISPMALASDRYSKQRAVYDVNYKGDADEQAYFKVLRNVQNHLNAVGKDNVELKVMLSGDGVDMLQKATSNLKLQGTIANLKMQKVTFLVCNNTLALRQIDPNKLFEVFKDDIVPSGNAELTHLQGNGYAYLKP